MTSARELPDSYAEGKIPRSRIALLLAGVLLLAGCSPPARPTTTSSTPASTVGQKPAVATAPKWTLAQAQARYEALADPVNTLLSAWDALPQNSDDADIADIHRVATDLAAANDAFAAGLTDVGWPAAAQPKIQTLAEDCRQDRIVWREISAAKTSYAAYSLYNDGGFEKGDADEGAVRAALGLPTA